MLYSTQASKMNAHCNKRKCLKGTFKMITKKVHIYLYNDDEVICNIFAISLDNHAKKENLKMTCIAYNKNRNCVFCMFQLINATLRTVG